MVTETPKPSDLTEYRRWLSEELKEEVDERYYDSAASRLLSQTEQSAIWKQVLGKLIDLDNKFYTQNDVFLLMHREPPKVVRKSFQSMLNKSYRKNVVDNPNWSDPPVGGWIAPSNWLSTINDPIRTTLVVKYLDGVSFLVVELENLAKTAGVPAQADYEAREEGYYACHLYFGQNGEVPDPRGGIRRVPYSFELQITTQLQDAIRPVTHDLYVARRARIGEPPSISWQWQSESDEFRGNYLAHTLHHIEGLIVDVRKRVRKGDASP